MSTPAMGPTQSPIRCIPGFFTCVNRPRCEGDHTLLSTANVKYGAIPPRPLYVRHTYRTLRLNFIVFVIISVNVVIVFTTARNISLLRATLIQSSTLYRIPLKIRLIILPFYSKNIQIIRFFLVLRINSCVYFISPSHMLHVRPILRSSI
jgi:hypothetical protein